MNLVNRLEQRIGNLAIPHLTRWITLLNVVTFMAIWQTPKIKEILLLDPERVMQGEVWRLFTYLFIPPTLGPLWIFFALYFFFMMGEGLEAEWGAFRLNLFYLIGMVATTAIAFLFHPGAVSNTYLNTSVFLAFATIYPDFVIYVFFILPVKVKWLGWITGALLGVTLIMGSLADKAAMLISVANYLLFFGVTIRDYLRGQIRESQSRTRLREFKSALEQGSFHHCAVCSRSEITDPQLGFRVAADGEEYCVDHLPSRQAAKDKAPGPAA